MSVHYEKLNDQIDQMDQLALTAEVGSWHPETRYAIKEVAEFLRYIRIERDSANLNPWENPSDHAANALPDDPTLV